MHLQVFAWGLNTSGQLGLNDALVRKSPAVVDALWAMPVQQLAAGQPHPPEASSDWQSPLRADVIMPDLPLLLMEPIASLLQFDCPASVQLNVVLCLP